LQQNEKIDSVAFYKKMYLEKGKLIEEILKSEPEGIKHNQLAKKLDIHRDTLRKDMKDVLEFGIVKRDSKKGKYHLNKDLKYPDFIKGLILSLNFSFYILGKENNILFDYSQVYNNFKKESVKQDTEEKVLGYAYDKEDYYLKYFEPKFDAFSSLEKNLFEFINQIGAYFIHVFLQNLANDNSPKDNKEIISLNDQWLDGALNRMYSRVYYEFIAKFFEYHPNQNQLGEIKEYIKENKLPKNEFVIKRTFLLLSFFHMYPVIGHRLHNMAEELGEDVKFHKEKRDESFKNYLKKNKKDP
jgi:hypothetical protein